MGVSVSAGESYTECAVKKGQVGGVWLNSANKLEVLIPRTCFSRVGRVTMVTWGYWSCITG